MNCENYIELIPEYISGELPDDMTAGLEKHISECNSCRDELNFQISLILNLSADEVDVPEGLNSLVIQKLPVKRSFLSKRYFAYSAAASVVLIIILSVYLNISSPVSRALPGLASNEDTIIVKTSQSDYASLGYIDQDIEDMIDYDAALYDDEKWSSDSSEIFASDNEIVNDLITLEEIETYDNYLSTL